jgi:hypothetical protein
MNGYNCTCLPGFKPKPGNSSANSTDESETEPGRRDGHDTYTNDDDMTLTDRRTAHTDDGDNTTDDDALLNSTDSNGTDSDGDGGTDECANADSDVGADASGEGDAEEEDQYEGFECTGRCRSPVFGQHILCLHAVLYTCFCGYVGLKREPVSDLTLSIWIE